LSHFSVNEIAEPFRGCIE